MARDHARLLFRIWSEDDDFISLHAAAQRLYILIISQPTLSYAGVTSFTVRRWTRLAADTPAAEIRFAAQELADRRFIIIDEDTEEVFVRTYIRNDAILANPNVAIAATRAYRQISSRTIRTAWIDELKRLHAESKASGTLAKAWTDPKSSKLLTDLLSESPLRPPSAQVNTNIEGGPEPLPEGGPREGVPKGVSLARAAPTPTPAPSPSPEMPAHSPSTTRAARRHLPAPDGAARTPTQRSKEITDAYSAVQPMSRWQAINGIVLTAIKAGKYGDDEIRAALLRLADDRRTVTVETLRIELEGQTGNHKGSNSGTGFKPYRNPTDPNAYAGYKHRPRTQPTEDDDDAA
jgi:hypothetical protein